MEELQSTEILDREILEDARRKAYRILKSADETVKAKAAEWERKTAETLAELKKKYAEQRGLAAAEIMARLPMDKRRARAEKIESLLGSAVENWYRRLSRKQVLAILRAELSARIAGCDEFFSGGECGALIRNLERAEAEAILEAAAAKISSIEEAPAADIYPELTLENRLVRITASIRKTVDFLLREKRAELVSSLIGTPALLETADREEAL